ncbi:MAG: hypothetical protein ACJ746_11380 [Bryobacteraceae bacterium]
MEAFLAVLGVLLLVSFALIRAAAKSSKTRQMNENRRAARRYDSSV